MRLHAPVLLLAGLLGCVHSVASDSLGPTDANIVGTFKLTAVNGLPLPITAQVSSAQAVRVDSETIVISANNTWVDTSATATIDLASGDVAPEAFGASGGTLTVTNGAIQFLITSGGNFSFTGSVQGTALTVLFNGSRFTYQRP